MTNSTGPVITSPPPPTPTQSDVALSRVADRTKLAPLPSESRSRRRILDLREW